MGKPRFIAGVYNSVPWVGLQGEISHEYDEWGSHRLVHAGRGGDWANWTDIATLKIKDRLFRGYSDFWSEVNEIEEVIAVAPRGLSDLYREDEQV